MKRALKGFMFCMVFTFTLTILSPSAIAQVGLNFSLFLGNSPYISEFYSYRWRRCRSFVNQPLDPFTGEGDILIDDFEYSDNPYNHGWHIPITS